MKFTDVYKVGSFKTVLKIGQTMIHKTYNHLNTNLQAELKQTYKQKMPYQNHVQSILSKRPTPNSDHLPTTTTILWSLFEFFSIDIPLNNDHLSTSATFGILRVVVVVQKYFKYFNFSSIPLTKNETERSNIKSNKFSSLCKTRLKVAQIQFSVKLID